MVSSIIASNNYLPNESKRYCNASDKTCRKNQFYLQYEQKNKQKMNYSSYLILIIFTLFFAKLLFFHKIANQSKKKSLFNVFFLLFFTFNFVIFPNISTLSCLSHYQKKKKKIKTILRNYLF